MSFVVEELSNAGTLGSSGIAWGGGVVVLVGMSKLIDYKEE